MRYSEMVKDMEFYQAIKKPYKLERSGSSVTMVVNGVKYFASTITPAGKKGNRKKVAAVNNKALPIDKLWFIVKVKRYIMKNKLVESIPPNYKSTKEIKYIALSKQVEAGEVFDAPYSIDINGAYWDSAFKGGWLSYELYLQGLEMEKTIRLASLGSFAKRIFQIEFNGKRERLTGVKEPEYPQVFFNQAKTINRVMEACRRAAGDDFLFYWTDGVYVKNKAAAERCQAVLERKNYGFKTEKLARIIRLPNGFQTIEFKNKKDEKKGLKHKMYRSDIE